MVEQRWSRDIWLAPLFTWGALCLLLLITATMAFVPLGRANLPVSLVIAAIKAGLVGWIFMRLSARKALNRLAASAGFIWIFVMFLLMGADYYTR
jgi:cytochrome c oxidase subunit 4